MKKYILITVLSVMNLNLYGEQIPATSSKNRCEQLKEEFKQCTKDYFFLENQRTDMIKELKREEDAYEKMLSRGLQDFEANNKFIQLEKEISQFLENKCMTSLRDFADEILND
jgi:alanyl-tRNA synthetase